MNLKSLLVFTLLSTILLLVSCNKDDDTNNRNTFSPNTVEENKQAIEEAGIALIRGVAQVEKEPAIDVIEALFFFLELSDPFDHSNIADMQIAKLRGSYAFIPNYSLASLNEVGYEGVLKSLAVNPLTDEPETIQEVYELLVGTYSWNANLNQWIYEPIGNTIKFKFPSEESKSGNNASYSINYQGYNGEVSNALSNSYEGDLPMSVKTSLEVNDLEIMNFNVNITYSTLGLPAGISSRIKLTSSEFIYGAENIDNEEAGFSFIFKNNEQLLLKFVLTGEGDWSPDNIENSIHYYQYVISNNLEFQEVEVSEHDDWDSMDFEVHKVVQGGNSLFQISNIKVEGVVDTEAIGDEIINMGDVDEMSDSTYWTTISKTMNENIDLSLRFVDSDEIIAIVEAYPVAKSESYYEYFYDGAWQDNPRLKDYTYYEISFRFKFADDSTIDLEVYFGEGFEELVTELEKLILELETEEEID